VHYSKFPFALASCIIQISKAEVTVNPLAYYFIMSNEITNVKVIKMCQNSTLMLQVMMYLTFLPSTQHGIVKGTYEVNSVSHDGRVINL
jgi:hypothetical protein